MIYYIFVYYYLFHLLSFITIYHRFYDIIYYNVQLGNIYYHLFHLLQVVFSLTTIYSTYYGDNL